MPPPRTHAQVLLKAIRAGKGQDFPIAVLAGHTHYRHYSNDSSQAAILESGCYFNTVGWLSFDTPGRVAGEHAACSAPLATARMPGHGTHTPHARALVCIRRAAGAFSHSGITL